MQDYFFGTMDEYIETGYAPSGRATCRGCRSKIENREVRLGEIMESDHFNSRHYYHVVCFKLKPLFRNIDPKRQIYKLDQLEDSDQKKVIEQVEMEKDRLNGGGKDKGKKKSAKKAKSKPSKVEKVDKREVDTEPQEEPPKRVTRSSSRPLAKSKPKSKALKKRSPSPSPQPPSEASPSPSPEKKKRSRATRVKASSKSTKSSAKKLKKTGPEQAYNKQQKEKMRQLREKYSQLPVARLKQILDANNQTKTGAKDDLVEKCADGELLGRIPLCMHCGGGKPRFMWRCSLYHCPGYMDDEEFKQCNRHLTMVDVKREPWVIPP